MRNDADSSYNALKVQFPFTVIASRTGSGHSSSYTRAHSIDDASSDAYFVRFAGKRRSRMPQERGRLILISKTHVLRRDFL